MPGTSAPKIDGAAKAIVAAIKAVSPTIPPEVVHDRERMILTRGGLALVGYDADRGRIHLWELALVSAVEREIPAGGFFIDDMEWAARGLLGYSDGIDDAVNSTVEFRSIVEAARNGLRAATTVFGNFIEAERTTRLVTLSLVNVEGFGVCHFAEIRFRIEATTNDI